MTKNIFEIKENFYFNGEKLKIISGSIHYFRSFDATWEDKLIKLKALGANTVETYVPWNLHESEEGKWNFEKNLDIIKFIKLAQKHELLLIIRFGPYICAEHDYGGIPWWIQLKENLEIRCNNEVYLSYVEKYINKICSIINPFLSSMGGNIILGQLENEYGSFGNDKEYLYKLKTIILNAGFTIPLITSDGSDQMMLENGTLFEHDVLPTVNFGSEPNKHFDLLEEKFPNIPLMCTEFWCGWFNSWGEEQITKRNEKEVSGDLREILKRGSVNIYMFHGGTNFGPYSGANQESNSMYTPDITSYDYDALLDERGNLTPKYELCRNVIGEFVELPEMDLKYIKSKKYCNVSYLGSSNIFANKNFEVIENAVPLPMEKLGYGYGYVLYDAILPDIKILTSIELQEFSDRATIYIDDIYIGELFNKNHLVLDNIKLKKNSCLKILVENLGRVNYGKYSRVQMKGIIDPPYINNRFFQYNWNITKIPLDYYMFSNLEYSNTIIHGQPQVHKYNLDIGLQEELNDTYIEFEGAGKGYIFVNGFNIGGFWDIGPQTKLYVPAQILHIGCNEVLVIESEGKFSKLSFTS